LRAPCCAGPAAAGGGMILATKVSQLGELVWVSAAAGLVVSLMFSLALLGVTRGEDARRARAGAVAAAWFALSLVTFAVFLATVVIAVILITTKS
ncbi:MAG TPA: hypothetical protein VFT42_02415, partial [Solirubrobacteraceae bacterium]|nr:hypothetical protein [Solirubrobacteraceae bacterium]